MSLKLEGVQEPFTSTERVDGLVSLELKKLTIVKKGTVGLEYIINKVSIDMWNVRYIYQAPRITMEELSMALSNLEETC